ncbi:MBL fold metallo-hydrolase [Neolewinella persica]|uniref:MBL fold metallo-hydrolase n=1 Tax=Neolewinella persica TaxID=70998 RepID=UPI0003796B59|nr:MBL fold metallo-hydrolase [Neolewinella persica]
MPIQLTTPHLTIHESQLFRTTSTIIHTDDYVLIVDPNWLPAEVDHLAELTAELGAGKEKYLLFTHSDYDHIIGYGKFPGFTTIASKAFVDNPQQADQLAQTIAWDDEYYIKRDYELTYPVIDLAKAKDGEKTMIGEDQYHFYQAPGHNYDGLVTFNKSRGILIVGDYLSNVEFPYVYHSFAEYRDTLISLRAIIYTGLVKVLITGHGDHTTDYNEMERRLEDSFAYLEELTLSVQNDTAFDLEKWLSRYDFPIIMRKFHDKNVALLRAEGLLGAGAGAK